MLNRVQIKGMPEQTKRTGELSEVTNAINQLNEMLSSMVFSSGKKRTPVIPLLIYRELDI